MFYLFHSSKSPGCWSTRGCRLKSFKDDLVVCSCDHLTNFAILMSPVHVETVSHLINPFVLLFGTLNLNQSQNMQNVTFIVFVVLAERCNNNLMV